MFSQLLIVFWILYCFMVCSGVNVNIPLGVVWLKVLSMSENEGCLRTRLLGIRDCCVWLCRRMLLGFEGDKLCLYLFYEINHGNLMYF